MSGDRVSVVCWLWTGRTMGRDRVDYGAEHVNRLASMVRRNLRADHEVVCITDSPQGIDPRVRVVPIWSDLAALGMCYRRLKLFDPECQRYVGGDRWVSIDLDTVITGPLDPLFDRPEPFVIWADPGRTTPYCGSMWMLRAGAHPEVWSTFDAQEALSLRRRRNFIGSDQAWMSHRIADAARWDRRDGVYSFRLHIAPGFPARPHARSALPAGARVVFFHGVHDPSQFAIQRRFPWVVEHWR